MSTDIVPAGNLPDVHGGATPGFMQFASRVTTLSAQALALKAGLYALQRRMRENADKARDVGEKCGQAEVDASLVALVQEASDALRKVADASGELANAADMIQTDAEALNGAHESEYRGVYEAVQASPYDQPKPGFLENR